ncbi:hypothetical protein FACS1894147_10030 [Spirochaetia bacterium]|nr:hypothetical protein FACS1894147_10030 [Spirochaetia bacterium]
MPDTLESQYTLIIVSAIASIAIISGAAYLLLTRRKVIFTTIQVITLCALTGFGLISLVKINTDFTAFAKRRQDGGQSLENIAPVFKFSKTGKNVLVIMLDRASSGYVPYIFEEKPELFTGFDGFTYYPNCVSFGSHTRIGAPPLFGGYEYIPSLIQKTLTMARTKHNEALLMMPKLFADAGYSATVTDPSLANYSLRPDLSIYSGYPEIHAENILGKYSGEWLKAHSDIQILSISSLLNTLLIRFSFFKIAPPIFRIFLYDKGEWLTIDDNASTELPLDSIDDYTTLDFLPQITVTTAENQNTYTAMVNELTHHPVYLQAPDYVPATIVSNRGTGPFADEPNYHVIIAAFILLENWFNYLREQQVYDNTRIIIVSDHGIGARSAFPNNITLPNGDCIQSYNPILLQKDFNTQGELITDSTFMTNADVPVLATAGLIENPINPFTYIPLQTQKENGVTITTASVLNYTIAPDEWLHVHDNIFDPSNWEKAEVSR